MFQRLHGIVGVHTSSSLSCPHLCDTHWPSVEVPAFEFDMSLPLSRLRFCDAHWPSLYIHNIQRYTYIYIYIYTHIERERDIDTRIYYIYTHTHEYDNVYISWPAVEAPTFEFGEPPDEHRVLRDLDIYIYIYIYIHTHI